MDSKAYEAGRQYTDWKALHPEAALFCHGLVAQGGEFGEQAQGHAKALREEVAEQGKEASKDLKHAARVWAIAAQWATASEGDMDLFTVHSSGSTGAPKPYTLIAERMGNVASLQCQVLGLEPCTHQVHALSLDRVGGLMALVRGLVAGLVTWAVPPSAQPLDDALLDWPAGRLLHFAALVPAQAASVLAHPASHHGDCVIILGGSAPTGEALLALGQHPAQVFSAFGMTETTSHVALRRLNGNQHGDNHSTPPEKHYRLLPHHHGWAEEETAGYDVEGASEVCAPGKPGLLCLIGPATDDAILRTNDVVSFNTDGTFDFVGRADFAINTGGYKVHPEVLEAQLAPHLQAVAGSYQWAIAPAPHPRWGQSVVLVVEDGIDRAALDAALAPCLADLQSHERPALIEAISPWPLNPGGKTDRRVLAFVFDTLDPFGEVQTPDAPLGNGMIEQA